MVHTMTTTEKRSGELARPEDTFQTTFVPRFDIWEGEDELLLFGDLPGVSPDSLDIRFEKGELTVHGKVGPRHEGESFLLRLRADDSHSRSKPTLAGAKVTAMEPSRFAAGSTSLLNAV